MNKMAAYSYTYHYYNQTQIFKFAESMVKIVGMFPSLDNYFNDRYKINSKSIREWSAVAKWSLANALMDARR